MGVARAEGGMTMDDLISKQSIMKRLHVVGGCGAPPDSWADGYDKAIDLAYGMVTNESAVDAVPVVRCKDCIHRRTIGRPPFVVFVCSHNKGLGDNVKDDDFCSYGEKREDSHD